jgi:hypothetical protein
MSARAAGTPANYVRVKEGGDYWNCGPVLTKSKLVADNLDQFYASINARLSGKLASYWVDQGYQMATYKSQEMKDNLGVEKYNQLKKINPLKDIPKLKTEDLQWRQQQFGKELFILRIRKCP